MEKSPASICPQESKFRVKAKFLLADLAGLRSIMLNQTPTFRTKMCCPDSHYGSSENNAAGEETRWQ
jgi:hypothetical protein